MNRTLPRLAAILLAVAGCNGQQIDTSAPHSGNSAAPVASSVAANGMPDRAVFEFLEAVRTGNDQQASLLLTPTARQKTSEMQMVVSPPGSATASFKVGQVEYVTPNKDGAHVWCTWTDSVDDQGHTRTDEIIWVLRHETEGWRIAGMVTKVYPDQPPLILNFEDPEDMLRKQQLLHQDASTGEGAAQSATQPQATRPDQSPTATR